MGDRANIVLRQHGPAGTGSYLYLYTHWEGYGLPVKLHDALAVAHIHGRLADEPYLARIVHDRLASSEGTAWSGFGITTYLTDNQRPLLVVDAACQEVGLVQQPSVQELTAHHHRYAGEWVILGRPISFAAYMALRFDEDADTWEPVFTAAGVSRAEAYQP